MCENRGQRFPSHNVPLCSNNWFQCSYTRVTLYAPLVDGGRMVRSS